MKFEFDNDYGMFTAEVDGVILAFDEMPEEGCEEELNQTAQKYWSRLDSIVEFMMPDLQEVYGISDAEEVKAKLGRPIIEPDNGRVTYCEHLLDSVHIHSFEYLDDDFENLQYFSMNG